MDCKHVVSSYLPADCQIVDHPSVLGIRYPNILYNIYIYMYILIEFDLLHYFIATVAILAAIYSTVVYSLATPV